MESLVWRWCAEQVEASTETVGRLKQADETFRFCYLPVRCKEICQQTYRLLWIGTQIMCYDPQRLWLSTLSCRIVFKIKKKDVVCAASCRQDVRSESWLETSFSLITLYVAE